MAHRYDRHAHKSAKMYDRMLQLMQREIPKDAFVLDIGTGTGEIPLRICHHVRCVEAIDYAENMISVAQEKAAKQAIGNVTFRVADCSPLPYDNKTFDTVIAANLLHVVPSPKTVLSEGYRVLKENGKLLAPTYVHNESWKTRIISWMLKRAGHPVHTRFNSICLRELVEKSGFEVTSQTLFKNIMPVSFIVARRALLFPRSPRAGER